MLHNLRTASVMLLAFTLLTGVAYPLAITGIGWVMMQDQALGSLVEKDGKVIGSSLVGQSFTSDALLPSAAVGDQRRRPGRCRQDGRCAVQRSGLDRLQPRSDHQEAARPRAGQRRRAAQGRRCRSQFRSMR